MDRLEESKPTFVPPRKRQSAKKPNGGVHNYIDHIVNVQTNQYPSTSRSLEDLLAKTSLLNQGSNEKKQTEKIPSKHDEIAKSHQTIDISYQPIKDESVNATPSSYSTESLKTRTIDSAPSMRQFKKRVNILTSDHPTSKQYLCNSSNSLEKYHELGSRDTSLLNIKTNSERSNSTSDNYMTLTGTIKRGRKKGQSLDLQLTISRDELAKINTAVMAQQTAVGTRSSCCSLTSGMHILLLSLISFPFVCVVTSIYAFYIGTLTWYNMFTYFNEEKPYLYKLVMSPLLVLAYPVGIILCSIGLAVYSGCVQISMKFTKWSNEVADIEKGFYGWLCSFLHLSDCSPYEVVILNDLKLPEDVPHANSSTEELSL